MTMSTTGLVVTILIIILGIYDLCCVVYGLITKKSTTFSVSAFLIKAGINLVFVAFAFGFVNGHLFGYMYPQECPPPSANILAPNFWMVFSLMMTAAYIVLWRKRNGPIRL